MRSALLMVLALALLGLEGCGSDPAPITPGRHVPFKVLSNVLVKSKASGNIVAARSREGLLGRYFGVPTSQAEQTCLTRWGGQFCLPGISVPAGSVALLVYLQTGCFEEGNVSGVTEQGDALFVGVRVQPTHCPPGAGAQGQPIAKLVMAQPTSPSSLSTAKVVYSKSEESENASTPIAD